MELSATKALVQSVQFIHHALGREPLANQLRNGFGRNQSSEDEMLFQSQIPCPLIEARAPIAVADQHELEMGALLHETRRYGKQIVVSLQIHQPSDFADDNIVRAESEF